MLRRACRARGKEIAARISTPNFQRASAPFVTVPNCASVAPEPDGKKCCLGRETPERGVEPWLLETGAWRCDLFDEVADLRFGTATKIPAGCGGDQQFTRVGANDKVPRYLRVISSTSQRTWMPPNQGRTHPSRASVHRLNVVPNLRSRAGRTSRLIFQFLRPPFHRDFQHLAGFCRCRESLVMLKALCRTHASGLATCCQIKNLVERGLILGDATGPVERRELPRRRDQPTTYGVVSFGRPGHCCPAMRETPKRLNANICSPSIKIRFAQQSAAGQFRRNGA